MSTAIEGVWEQLKRAAHSYAERGADLDEREAEMIVHELLHGANVSPWPSEDVVQFYTQELLRMFEREHGVAQ